MARYSASNINIGIALYLVFNLITVIPGFAVMILVSNITSGTWLHTLIANLLMLPVYYLAVKYAALYVNKNYVVKDKNKVVFSALKVLFVLYGLVEILMFYSAGYITAGMVSIAFTVTLIAGVIYKFAPNLIQETSTEEVALSANLLPERHIFRTVLLGVLGFVFFLLVPFMAMIFYSEQFGNIFWLIPIAYFVAIFFLFKKVFFNKVS
ncbi:MAG TPA: hypothetical protein VJJ02_01410 [Candidatus Paceibacterota bacterium]